MMAANRRLHHRVKEGRHGDRMPLDLPTRTDKLLGVILLFDKLDNAAVATLVSVIAIRTEQKN